MLSLSKHMTSGTALFSEQCFVFVMLNEVKHPAEAASERILRPPLAGSE